MAVGCSCHCCMKRHHSCQTAPLACCISPCQGPEQLQLTCLARCSRCCDNKPCCRLAVEGTKGATGTSRGHHGLRARGCSSWHQTANSFGSQAVHATTTLPVTPAAISRPAEAGHLAPKASCCQLAKNMFYHHNWRLLKGEAQFSDMPLPLPLPDGHTSRVL